MEQEQNPNDEGIVIAGMSANLQQLERAAVKRPIKAHPHPLHSRQHIEFMIERWHIYNIALRQELEALRAVKKPDADMKYRIERVSKRCSVHKTTRYTLGKLIRDYNSDHRKEEPIRFIERETVRDKEAQGTSDTSSGSKSE